MIVGLSMLVSHEQSGNAIDGAAKKQVGGERQERHGEKQFEEINALMNYNLVNHVENSGNLKSVMRRSFQPPCKNSLR